MISGQRWSAATRSARKAPSSGLALVASDMAISFAGRAELNSPRRQRGDGDEKVGGLRRVRAVAGRLRGAFAGDEAGITVLPAGELSIEEGAPGSAVGEGRQVAVEAGEETAGARRDLGVAAGG